MTRTVWRRRALAVALSHALLSPAFAADITWSTLGTGFWDDAANWPGGIPPTVDDDVTLDLGTSTAVIRQVPGSPAFPLSQFIVGSLLAKSPVEHAGGSLMVKGDATFEDTFSWSGGILHIDGTVPSGSWTFKKGLHFTAPGLVGMNAGSVELLGTSVLAGGNLLFGSVPVHIAAGATVDIQSGDRWVIQNAWINDGTLDRTAGTGTYQIFMQAGGNQSVVRARTGALELLQTGFDGLTHSGAFSVDAGAELRFVGTHTLLGAVSGAGDVTFSGFADYTVSATQFALDGTLTLENGAKGVWNGDGTVKNLRFLGGNFLPQGQVDVVNQTRVDGIGVVIGQAGSRARFLGGLDLKANFIVSAGAVELGGTTVMEGDVGLGVGNDATLTVLSGALLRLANDATPQGAGAIIGPGRFINQGLVQRDTATGEFRFSVTEFVNEGRFVLKSGRASAAVDFTQTDEGTFAIELGSVDGPFEVGSHASLGGVLEIGFADGFLPSLGQTFGLMTFGTRAGTFTLTTVGEAARSGYTYALHHGDHVLGLKVTELAPPVPEPATCATIGAGLLLLLGMRRRRRGCSSPRAQCPRQPPTISSSAPACCAVP